MKIILTAAISKLGVIGDVVEVKNGYAKNFLIPSKKAICYTVNNYKAFDSKRKEFEHADQKGIELANKVKDQIAGKDVVIIENASDDGRLYGSVNSANIASKVNEIIGQKAVTRANVFLKKPIKEIGVYEVALNLHSSVEITARLIVTRSESEINALLKADKKSSKASEKSSEVAEAAVEAVEEVSEEVKAEKPKKPRKKKVEAV